jgi:toxin ParE1/3/4
MGQAPSRIGQAGRWCCLILKWLPKAIANRDSQIDFIAKDNPLAAISQGNEIEQQVQALVGNPPMSGRPGRKSGTRELVISKTPFVAVFRANGQTVEVLRLLHSSQQWPPAPKKANQIFDKEAGLRIN